MATKENALKKVYREAQARVEQEYIALRELQDLVGIDSDALANRARRAGLKTFVGAYPGLGPRVLMMRREDAADFVARLANPRPSARNI